MITTLVFLLFAARVGSAPSPAIAAEGGGATRIDWLLQHAGALQSAQQRHADLAIPFLREAVDLAESSHDPKREGRALIQLGTACHSTHQLDDAQAAFMRAIELARKNGDTASEVDALAGIGSMSVDRGNYDAAQKWLRAVLDIGTRDDDVASRVRGLNGLAAIADRRGRSAEGERYARIALAELDAQEAAI